MRDWQAAARNWCRRAGADARIKTPEKETEKRPVYTPEEEAMAEKSRKEIKEKLGIMIPR